jgi:putative flippase GtrA
MTHPAADEQAVRTAGPLGTLVATFVVEPGRRPTLVQSLARFAMSGGLSVGVDVAALYLLHSLAHLVLAAATVIAYALSLAVNYSLNHAWVFQAEGDHRRRLARYGALVALNVGSTLGFVLGLTAVGVYYLLAKLVAVATNAVLNFAGFRFWVFR